MDYPAPDPLLSADAAPTKDAAEPVIPDLEPKYKYWAAEDSAEIGVKLCTKLQECATSELAKEMRRREARAYQYYNGLDPAGTHATSQVLRDGEQGELAAVRVNHSRSLVSTLQNLITAAEVTWVPKATNVDVQSVRDCEFAAAVLEYYFNEREVRNIAVRALEEALVFSEGFVLLEWDEGGGDDFAASPESPTDTERTGDVVFRNISTWDVIRDGSKQNYRDLQWVIVRVPRNKYDLMALYPGYEDQIFSAGAADPETEGRARQETASEDDVPTYVFLHRPTPALPSGRRTLFLGNKLVLEDGELEGGEFPLYRVASSDLIGTPYGYTQYLDILGVQEVMDSLQTSVATNQTALATQMVAIWSGSEIDPDDVGGMKIINIPPDGKKPEAVQLTQSPPEVFNHLKSLKDDQRNLIGLNAVVMGETPSGELSGSAHALLVSQVQQRSSNIQLNYNTLLKNLGTGVLGMFKRKAALPRKIALTGQSGSYLATEETLTGDRFDDIKSVTVEIGNPMLQNVAGRTEMAKELVGLGIVKTPEQYIQVVNTGQIKPMTQSITRELQLILDENQAMARGEPRIVLVLDDHLLHAREHRGELANPEVRKNPAAVKAILEHIHQHEEMYYGGNPMTLMLVGQQPPPMMGPGMGPSGAPPGAGGPPGPGGPPPPPGGAPSEGPKPPGNPTAGAAPEPPSMPRDAQTGQPVAAPVANGARPTPPK